MSVKKTVGTVMLTSGLASGVLVAGFALPASATTATASASASASAASASAVGASAASVTARLAAATALEPWPVLREGPNSTWPSVTVRSLQYLLDARGAKVTADGIFGAGTKAAVVAFQRAHHLAADGVVGPQTWDALIVTVKLGSTGFAVRAVEDQADYRFARYGYSLPVDGIFGPETELFVRAFQYAGGLTPDGIVGPLTWQALVTESVTA
jgi:peptidoglycan hydrolase-like protein with peptidoglycan-binding domain